MIATHLSKVYDKQMSGNQSLDKKEYFHGCPAVSKHWINVPLWEGEATTKIVRK